MYELQQIGVFCPKLKMLDVGPNISKLSELETILETLPNIRLLMCGGKKSIALFNDEEDAVPQKVRSRYPNTIIIFGPFTALNPDSPEFSMIEKYHQYIGFTSLQ
jgi:hypothetical protein